MTEINELSRTDPFTCPKCGLPFEPYSELDFGGESEVDFWCEGPNSCGYGTTRTYGTDLIGERLLKDGTPKPPKVVRVMTNEEVEQATKKIRQGFDVLTENHRRAMGL
jgi:hypothetical protein